MIKVIIVDDSAVMRTCLQEVLSAAGNIEVIATAPDPIFALQKMRKQWPDVIILDVEMPRMDGITFLREVMNEHPTPIIIFSSLAEQGSETAFQALHAGAVSIMPKPKSGFTDSLKTDFIHAVREAANAELKMPRLPLSKKIQSSPEIKSHTAPIDQNSLKHAAPKMSADTILAAQPSSKPIGNAVDKIVAIGTSTGGTQALEFLLSELSLESCGIVIVQHMPANFTRMFAERLNAVCKLEIREAQDGDSIKRGCALIAPGGKHMTVKRAGNHYTVNIVDGPLVARHKPSVDVLFRSVANNAGTNALGIIMTGMGDDGARGLKEMFDVGATTIAQDEQSCVVFGMPKEAILHKGVGRIASLDTIPNLISDFSLSGG